MPLYEYACRSCARSFEDIRRYEERLAAPSCPACGSPETVLRLSAPAFVGAAAGSAGTFCGGDPDSCELGGGGGCCGGACAH